MESAEVYEKHRESVRRFAEQEVKPYAAIVDRDVRIPVESIKAFPKLGLSGLPFPEELGGSAGDLMAQVITVEEVSRACASSAHALMTTWVAVMPLVMGGDDALKRQIVPEVSAGKLLASFCLTEPSGGSDLPGLKTKAERTAEGWRIDGNKRFISYGGASDWYAVLARTGERAYGVFMVHRDDPGISFGAPEKKMGTRGSPLSDVIFDDCVIPEDRVVGDPTEGYALMMRILTYSRPIIAAQALGIAQGALEEAIAYTSQRTQFNTKVSRFQMIRGMVADMTTRVEAARSLLYRAVAIAEEDNDRARAFASMAKVMCTDTAMSVTTDAVQLHGGYGYLMDYPVERMMRDAKITQIWEGTNQIQKLLIAKYAYAGTE